jgi:predicted nuclease of predicted toxin-antitoxin system
MLLLADENVHANVVRTLREKGFNLEWVKESSKGASDVCILQRSDINMLVLVTNDGDFGELIFHKGFPTPYAILYTRITHRDWKLCSERLIAVINSGVAAGRMITITPTETRSKQFPLGA